MSLNTTFTKEDGTEVVIPFNGSQNGHPENEEPEVEEAAEPSSSVETLCGATRGDIIVMKHTTKALTELIERLLHSDGEKLWKIAKRDFKRNKTILISEFEVRRCSNGQIISQGRCNGTTPGNGIGGGGASSEELEKALKDRDAARAEADKLHANYATLFASFNTVREAANDIRGEYEDARDKLKLAAAEVDEWQAKFLAVKDNANSELERWVRENLICNM